MTTRERLERKLEKREEWAEKAQARSLAESEAARAITEHIPLGQPILVGHYSEAGHRRDLARSTAHLEHACEHADRAEHHLEKARGLAHQLNNSIFHDDEDATEKLRAKIAEREKFQEQAKAINKICRAAKLSDDEKRAQILAIMPGLSAESIADMLHPEYGAVGFPSYMLTNNNAEIRRLRGRIADIEARAARAEAADNAGGVLIEGGEYIRVTFAEKPAWEILRALKSAGFYWRGGCWHGTRAALPEEVKELAE